MNDEEYVEVKKKFQYTKPKEGFMVIYLSYDKELILPHKDGIAFLASLVNAEMFSGDYTNVRINDLGNDTIKVKMMSYLDYERHKVAALLNVTYKELKEHETTK